MKANSKEDYWKKVKSGHTDACWEWLGSLNTEGYGTFRYRHEEHTNKRNKEHKAHRLAFYFAYGNFPECVLHKCDNPKCCNPKHLFAGTIADNNKDKQMKGRAARNIGEKSGVAKITEKDVIKIRKLYADDKMPRREILKMFNIKKSQFHNIITGVSWGHIPGSIKALEPNKLIEDDVLRIKKIYKTGDCSQNDLAKMFDVSPSLIGLILNGKRWSYLNE